VAKQKRSQEVIQKVVDAVCEALLQMDESLIRIPEICDQTGVNYGSVYHHFGSRDGVIDEAYAQLYVGLVETDVTFINDLVARNDSFDDFVQGCRQLIEVTSNSSDRRTVRSIRIRILAASQTRPELFMKIASIQTHRTTEIEKSIIAAQKKGFIRSEVSAHEVSVAIQTLLIGRTLDDTSLAPVSDEQWANITERFLFSYLSDTPKPRVKK